MGNVRVLPPRAEVEHEEPHGELGVLSFEACRQCLFAFGNQLAVKMHGVDVRDHDVAVQGFPALQSHAAGFAVLDDQLVNGAVEAQVDAGFGHESGQCGDDGAGAAHGEIDTPICTQDNGMRP